MIPGLLGSLSGGFKMTDIGGCLLWLDTSILTGLVEDDLITGQNDLSGNGNNEATITDSPVFKLRGGRKVARFSGTQRTGGPISITGSSISSFVVASFADAAVFQNALAVDLYATSLGQYSGLTLFGRVGATAQIRVYNPNEDADTDPLTYDDLHIISVISNGSNLTIWADGTQGQSVLQTATYVVSYYNSGGNEYSGDLCERAIFNRGITPIERMVGERVLASKWGITINQSPVNTVLPTISASGWTPGQIASSDTGTWTNTPTTYTYQWQRKDGGYTNIPGATNATYLLDAADAGKYVRCGVVPSNAFATGTVAYSADSDLIA